jgi:drug/metabolite transporter (DMT)-like permease
VLGFFLAVAIVAVSTAAPLVRLAEPAPAILVAAARVTIATLALSAIARRDLFTLVRLPRREQLLCAASGLLLAAHFGVWIASLYFTSTASSVALVATNPVFAGLFAWLVLGEGIARREGIGIAIAAVGCAVLAGGDVMRSDHAALLGDGLALAGAITAAAYLVVGRRMRASLPLAAYLAIVNAVAACALIALLIVTATPVRGFEREDYVAMLLAGIVPSVIGHSLLNWSVRRVRVHLIGLVILGEPVGASLLAFLFFAEAPPVEALIGGAIIVGGIAIGFARPRAPRPVQA